MEAKPNTTRTVALTRQLPQRAEAVWQLLRSGGDVHRILPGVIETCRVEGAGAGAKRYCTTPQGALEETILHVDDEARLFRYRIDRQSMMPIEHYEGSVHVTDLGSRGAQVLWFATFQLVEAGADAQVRQGLQGLFQTAIDGMGRLVENAR